ncbi:hypothetical protein DOT_0824 [Desulfosporosinus sp. OT]|nr:hypothetical protein DOT_0824 [Desulfosporosinus sp. OT]ODA39668.1 hypothetical protein DSBG_3525 [Desulfosporosinus sp. BG]
MICQIKGQTKRKQGNQTEGRTLRSRKKLLKAGHKPGFFLERISSKKAF